MIPFLCYRRNLSGVHNDDDFLASVIDFYTTTLGVKLGCGRPFPSVGISLSTQAPGTSRMPRKHSHASIHDRH